MCPSDDRFFSGSILASEGLDRVPYFIMNSQPSHVFICFNKSVYDQSVLLMRQSEWSVGLIIMGD